MKTTVSTKGQIVFPAELRRQDCIRPGQQFDVERLGAGQYLLTKQTTPDQAGILDWLLACPESNWFHPLPSGATDEI